MLGPGRGIDTNEGPAVTGSMRLPDTEPARGTEQSDGSPRRSADADREALCNALPRVVAEHGWAQTSPARLALAADIPPQEFWDHYRSLEHCFVEVYDRMMERVMRTAIRA